MDGHHSGSKRNFLKKTVVASMILAPQSFLDSLVGDNNFLEIPRSVPLLLQLIIDNKNKFCLIH
jgi:hypothetical protein